MRSRRDERELAEFRSDTVFCGVQVGLTVTGYELLELRNDRSGSTRARRIGTVVEHVGGELSCDCCGCGREYDAEDGLPLEWSGGYLASGCWCSDRCRERHAIEAGTTCYGCGAAPRHVGLDGGCCLACLRGEVRADLTRLALLDDSDAVQAFAAQTGLFPAAEAGDAAVTGATAAA